MRMNFFFARLASLNAEREAFKKASPEEKSPLLGRVVKYNDREAIAKLALRLFALGGHIGDSEYICINRTIREIKNLKTNTTQERLMVRQLHSAILSILEHKEAIHGLQNNMTIMNADTTEHNRISATLPSECYENSAYEDDKQS